MASAGDESGPEGVVELSLQHLDDDTVIKPPRRRRTPRIEVRGGPSVAGEEGEGSKPLDKPLSSSSSGSRSPGPRSPSPRSPSSRGSDPDWEDGKGKGKGKVIPELSLTHRRSSRFSGRKDLGVQLAPAASGIPQGSKVRRSTTRSRSLNNRGSDPELKEEDEWEGKGKVKVELSLRPHRSSRTPGKNSHGASPKGLKLAPAADEGEQPRHGGPRGSKPSGSKPSGRPPRSSGRALSRGSENPDNTNPEPVHISLSKLPKILIADPGLNQVNCALGVYKEMLHLGKPTKNPNTIVYDGRHLQVELAESLTARSSLMRIADSQFLFFTFMHFTLPNLDEIWKLILRVRSIIEMEPLLIGIACTGPPSHPVTKIFKEKKNNCMELGFHKLFEDVKQRYLGCFKDLPTFMNLSGDIDYVSVAQNILDNVTEYLVKEEQAAEQS